VDNAKPFEIWERPNIGSRVSRTVGEAGINRLSPSFRVTVPALNVDKLAAKLSGLRFAPRTRIGVCAGFGSPGSITSGSATLVKALAQDLVP
jgi:hypothetical protein